jgi:hypothetical protein
MDNVGRLAGLPPDMVRKYTKHKEVFMKMSFYYLALGAVIMLAGCSKDAGSADVGPSSSISGGAGGEGSGPTGTGGGESADNPAADNPAPGGTGTDPK